MARIPRNQVRSHDDFFTTPLGQWARHHDDAILTGLPASLANLHAALNGLGNVR
jgi:hypothetical protein